jgi:hypothetical protein
MSALKSNVSSVVQTGHRYIIVTMTSTDFSDPLRSLGLSGLSGSWRSGNRNVREPIEFADVGKFSKSTQVNSALKGLVALPLPHTT